MEVIYRGCSNTSTFIAPPLVKAEAKDMCCVYSQDGERKAVVQKDKIEWVDNDNHVQVTLSAELSLHLEAGKEVQVQLQAETQTGTRLASDVGTAWCGTYL